MLAGKKLLITGVITRDSIACEVARQAQEAGAEVVLTGFGRAKRLTERAAKQLPEPPDVLELDVNEPEDLEARRRRAARALGPRRRRPARDRLRARGRARRQLPRHAGRERDHRVPDERVLVQGAGRGAAAADPEDGGAIVGMDFDAQVAWPVYDWMGVAKAALEAISRYLARDLGPRGVRVNLVSAGPLGTIAARGIPGFDELADAWEQQAPLGWDTERRRPGRGRRLLPAVRPRARDHRRDPARRRRLPRHGHRRSRARDAPRRRVA